MSDLRTWPKISQILELQKLTGIYALAIQSLFEEIEMTTAQSVSHLKVLMTGRIRDLGRIYESGSQNRKRKEER